MVSSSPISINLFFFLLILGPCLGLLPDFSIVGYSDEDLSSSDRLLDLFESWVAKHGKSYAGFAEKLRRFEVFKDNLRHIDAANREGNYSYWLGLNEFADLTHEEFKVKYLGVRADAPSGRRSSASSFSLRMMRRKWNLSFLLCLIPCLLLHTTTKADPFKASCNGSNYDSGSAFSANLATLFSSLTSLSSASNSDTATAGSGADTAYGLYMCQGDLSGTDCQICIQTATADAGNSCPNLRGGVLWYDRCELRYSDANFFGVAVTDGFNFTNPNEVTSSKKPVEVLSELVLVAPTRSPLMYAVNVSDVLPLYALAQCTADLSAEGCRTCLTSSLETIERCCSHSKGWRYLTPSCWIRYEPTPFFGDYPNANDTYIIRSQCASGDFLSNSVGAQQQLNLRSLFAVLKSQASLTGFYNTSTGENSSNMYGLALCGGDATPGGCAACLGTAGSAIQEECPNKTEGYMWYDKCFLKYSNQNFFGQLDVDEHTFCEGGQIAADIAQITATEAGNLANEAANSSSMFAAGRAATNSTVSIYLLLQCTRDLSSEMCRLCLDAGINKMMNSCKQDKGWQYLSGSCTVRFELFPFFNASNTWQATQEEEKKTSKVKIIAVVSSIACLTLLGVLAYCAWKLTRSKGSQKSNLKDFSTLQDRDLTFIDLVTIQVATDHFSDKNKLGEGGFGPVYKGMLQGGTEIAVKRLSQKSTQGLSEFKNEMKLIAQLQHKNLVRLLGCCVEGQEKLLIYEYLPNKSLDFYLADPNKRAQLNWERRFLLISGIAKGLLYLHEDSFLKVIHRDLKPSNILLDKEMNPKISDFGLSKIYVAEESQTETHNRIVGTYGYMAPEYAMDGLFSAKYDVFSFGIVLLEIISGASNGRAHGERHGQSLLGHAWDMWNKDKATELIDPLLENQYSLAEAMKCISLGLLCVQKDAEVRPTMSAVVLVLQSDHIVLPQPSSPPKY